MSTVLVRLPYDPTGRNPNNLVTSEQIELKAVTGFPYKIITLYNGGFYLRGLRVYDEQGELLIPDVDYIDTYYHKKLSTQLGLQICSAIVFLDKTRTGKVYVTAQMVGGDLAFSLTVVQDYVSFYATRPPGYIPKMLDYVGNEPIWLPGELDKDRWKLDTYQPFNNEIYYMSRAVLGASGNYESTFRAKVKADHDAFINGFTNRLANHISDYLNPHKDAKNHIGLPLVENYATATEQQARTGTNNDLYLTPLTTSKLIDELADKPLLAHIALRNPHQTTPAKINAPTKATVQFELGKKYGSGDTVANATLITDGTQYINAQSLIDGARRNIPAQNFAYGGANGLLDPRRVANGTPSDTTVVRSDNLRWVDWGLLQTEYGGKGTPDIFVMDATGLNYAQAFYKAVSLPFAITAPEGSMVLYNLQITYAWAGGGLKYITHTVAYGAIKTTSGWKNIVTP